MSEVARVAAELAAASRALRLALEEEDASLLRAALARREAALLQLMACTDGALVDAEARAALQEAALLDAESLGRARVLQGEVELALGEIGAVRARLARIAGAEEEPAPRVDHTA